MNFEDIALDKDLLDELEKFVRIARFAGFESLSSPVSLLLEAATDVAMSLSLAFKEGRPKSRRTNPQILFLERKSDALGNPLQQTRTKRVAEVWDPTAAEFFRQLARFFVSMKNKGRFSRKDFMSFMEPTDIFPPVFKEKKQKQLKRVKGKASNNANYFYYRRQRRK